MKLYNTLTRKVEEVEPINSGQVSVYTCGPTVYDYPHVGNWFTFIRYDVLVRALNLADQNPQWVMNITDVGHLVSDADEGEDKLEKGAKREGKTAWDVAKFYGDYFAEGLKRLNITQPMQLPRATEHIEEQIALVKKLEELGYTYTIDDGVYYDTSKFEGYAAFARLDLDDLQAGARVDYNRQKRNPSDFALWKFSPEDQTRDMEWESPWGKGFPGWHLECSAMAMKYLGDTIDVHSGGIDHIPIHHTNEIAQSEAATGKRFANYWMHANHVTVEGEKISKSLGNGITLEDIEAKGFSLEAFRLHVLESHYRSQSKFSWESLEAAQNRLRNYRQFADLLWQLPDEATGTEDFLKDIQQNITQKLLDDLNTPAILTIISEVESQHLRVLASADKKTLKAFLQFIDSALGLTLANTTDISEEQYALIEKRDKAREQQDWVTADKLRDELTGQGIGLRDLPEGAIWHRV